MSDTHKTGIEDALTCDPSLFISSIPTPPFDRQRIRESWTALVNEVKRLQPIERELAAMTKRADEMERLKEHNGEMFYLIERELVASESERMKYRERAWHAELQLKMRYGFGKRSARR